MGRIHMERHRLKVNAKRPSYLQRPPISERHGQKKKPIYKQAQSLTKPPTIFSNTTGFTRSKVKMQIRSLERLLEGFAAGKVNFSEERKIDAEKELEQAREELALIDKRMQASTANNTQKRYEAMKYDQRWVSKAFGRCKKNLEQLIITSDEVSASEAQLRTDLVNHYEKMIYIKHFPGDEQYIGLRVDQLTDAQQARREQLQKQLLREVGYIRPSFRMTEGPAQPDPSGEEVFSVMLSNKQTYINPDARRNYLVAQHLKRRGQGDSEDMDSSSAADDQDLEEIRVPAANDDDSDDSDSSSSDSDTSSDEEESSSSEESSDEMLKRIQSYSKQQQYKRKSNRS